MQPPGARLGLAVQPFLSAAVVLLPGRWYPLLRHHPPCAIPWWNNVQGQQLQATCWHDLPACALNGAAAVVVGPPRARSMLVMQHPSCASSARVEMVD
jgi:hypothetical protein